MRGVPAHRAGDQIGNAGIAFPPVLMRVAQATDHHRDAVGFGRIGDIPDFVRAVAEIAQQIKFALAAMRQVVAAAHAHHRRAADFSGAVFGLARNVDQIFGTLGIGHVHDGSAVGLHLAGLRVHRFAAVMADVSDPTVALLLDDGLIRAARLQVVVTHQVHVAGAWRALRRRGRSQRFRGQKTAKRKAECKPSPTF